MLAEFEEAVADTHSQHRKMQQPGITSRRGTRPYRRSQGGTKQHRVAHGDAASRVGGVDRCSILPNAAIAPS